MRTLLNYPYSIQRSKTSFYFKIRAIIKEFVSTSIIDSLDKLLDELDKSLCEQNDQAIVDELSGTINKWLTQKHRVKK